MVTLELVACVCVGHDRVIARGDRSRECVDHLHSELTYCASAGFHGCVGDIPTKVYTKVARGRIVITAVIVPIDLRKVMARWSVLILARSPLKYDDVRSTNACRSVEMPSAVSVVVHPNRIFREGLVSVLAKVPFETACSAASIQEVPSTIASAGEQILVLIGVRENSDLAQALSMTKAILPDAHIVVVGDASKRGNVRTALELGATSFVDENIETSSLVKELELVMLGAPVISVSILKQLLRHSCTSACMETAAPPAIDEPPPPDAQKHAEPRLQLSDREAAILNSLVLGAPNKVIAYQLNITEATVKVHVKAILRKIQVKNRTQAAIWAVNRQVLAETLGATNGALPHPNQY